MKSTTVADLKELKVLVTRPEHQAQGLCQALESAGATPLPFPVIEIAEPQDGNKALETFKQLEQCQWLIFVSANAAEYGVALLEKHQITLPEHVKLAAVGQATAKKLAQLGLKNIITPKDRFDSEGLLLLDDLADLTDSKVIIVRGQGGRETLAEGLTQRGAEVRYAEVYRRCKPAKKLDNQILQTAQIAIVTSNEGLNNLWQMASQKQRSHLKQLPLLVMSERNHQHATKLGYKGEVVIAQQQNDEGLMVALRQWQQRGKEQMSQKQQNKQSGEPTKGAIEKRDKPPLPAEKTQAKSTGNSGRGIFTGLGLLVIAGGIVVGGYLLWKQQNRIAENLFQQLKVSEQSFDQKIAELGKELKESDKQREIAVKSIEKLQKENNLLWQSLRAMEQQDGHDKRPWQLAEAAYLMRLANHRLQLERDINGAIAGLESADQILKQVADPALLKVREQLSRELTQLKVLEQVDRDGLSAQLITLSESIRQLPIQGVELVELQPQSEEIQTQTQTPTTDVSWENALDRVWGEMRSLVVITRNDKPVMPLIPADQRSYLQHNVELQLESARLAMLQGDQKVWLASLSHARNWLFDYFDHQMPSVKNSIELLRTMEKINVAATLPDISGSLRELKKQQQRLKSQSSATEDQSESLQ